MFSVLRRLTLALLSCATLAAAAATPAPWPPVLGETLAQYIDNPQAMLAAEQARAASASAEERFWHLLLVARLQLVLELDDDTPRTLQQAAAALATQRRPDPAARRWLEATRLRQVSLGATDPALLKSLAALRNSIPTGASVLRCELLDTEAWFLQAIGSLDEAWRAAESLDACGAETGWPFFRALAALTQGQIAAANEGSADAAARAEAYFERADAEAGSGRFLRSLIGFSAGTSLAGLHLAPAALRHLKRVLAISRTLDDAAGIAAAQSEIAAVDLDLGRPADALAPLQEAEGLLRTLGEGESARLLRIHVLRLRALAQLRLPELRERLAQVAALNLSANLPQTRRSVMLAMAEGEAALGHHAEAYRLMQRARQFDSQARQLGRDAQVLQLQMRYETTRRDAEIAALRHQEESARLTMQAQAATQRGLWAALGALLVVMATAAMLARRSLRRRREWADLALRDALTGLPNRRAIEAYARAQLQQARRLGLPYALALIDLDHFKQINDRHGHPTGDAVLEALAHAVPTVLRAPDRLGRWGGEEFLLVLPGTRGDELDGVFTRLLAAFAVVEVPGLPVPHGVSFSMGGAEADGGADLSALLAEADRRLYAAKAAGRGTWR